MSDIFISYAREDLARARLFADALQAKGWTVWWDRTIRPGQNFDEAIEKALDQSHCVVVLWSKYSIDSNWVKTEAAEASDRGILVPALIDDVRIPFEFRRRHAARLVEWTGDASHEDFRQLCEAISGIMSTAAPAAPLGPADAGRQPSPERPARPARASWRIPVALLLGVLAAVALGSGGWYLLRPRKPIVVGVMEIRSRGEVAPWMCDFTRDGLNTVLSKVKPLNVYSRQKIDLLERKRGLSEMEAAEQLGIAKMISGTLSQAEHAVVLEIEVVDGTSGLLIDTKSIRGSESELVELQNKAAEWLIELLKVPVAAAELHDIFASRTDDQLDSYKLLTESMGGFVDDADAAPAPKAPAPAGKPGASLDLGATAWAGDSAEEKALRDMLEQYRLALEKKDVDKVSALYVEMNPAMKDALVRYFKTADNLSIRFAQFDILIEGNEAVATFTRYDDFQDTRSGREMHLEVRVSSVVAKQGTDWKIKGLKKPS